MITESEAAAFLLKSVIIDARGSQRNIIFYGVLRSIGPGGLLIDNGEKTALVPLDDVLRIRERDIHG